jgi:uncharacterized BrkB/YihY/UPF0761 family membrane protein
LLPVDPRGAAIQGHIGLTEIAFTVIWDVIRWAVTIVLVTLLFSVYCFFGPNHERARWQWVSPGGVVGSAIFLAGLAILLGAELNAAFAYEAAVRGTAKDG